MTNPTHPIVQQLGARSDAITRAGYWYAGSFSYGGASARGLFMTS
jgi:hypothetical protein